jgi:cysteine desulfurase family protein (TIGR01976 family)
VPLPIDRIRARFPSLSLRNGGRQRIYFDNPAGTQIARQTLERMNDYMLHCVGNSGGAFRTAVATDAMVDATRAAMAQFLNARSPREVVFGGSMTTLTLHMTRALEKLFAPGDEIIVTRMDHDGNVSPWRLMAERCGLTLKTLDFDGESFRYDLAELDRLLSRRTKLIAVNHASNLIGTISDVGAIARRAQAVGALSYVDAVQSAPHCPIDVQALGCDFLVCSAYKFFGPHLGILWGREELLESLMPPKLRAATDVVPNRYETGTLPFELIAGVLGALEYYAWVGDSVAPRGKAKPKTTAKTRATGKPSNLGARIRRGKLAMQAHEKTLSRELIRGLRALPGARIYGITAESELDERVSTVSFTLAKRVPRQIATELAKREIYVWSGGNYAVDMLDKFGLTGSGGMIRVGPVHYNTVAEVERFLAAMRAIVRG